MEKRRLGKTGYDVSAISYGGIVSTDVGQESSDRHVAWAIDHGINYFDVAPVYGDAQEKLGNSLIPYRDRIYLACKTRERSRKAAEQDMVTSMKLLHTDWFDTYQLHELKSIQEVEQAFAPGGAMELLRDMKEKGIARKLGITAHSEDAALMALDLYDFDSVLFPYNWHMNLSKGMGNRLIRVCKERNIGILCMKSMIERAWDDTVDTQAHQKFPKSWCKPIDPDTDGALLLAAMKYSLSLGVDTLIPPGNFSHFSFGVEHIDEALTHPLNEDDRKLLNERLEQVRDRPFFR